MDKYYVPSLEEFHVGFEFEKAVVNNDWAVTGWNKALYHELDRDLDLIKKYPEWQRVKYLDREDIESLGFKQLGPNGWISDKKIRIKHLKNNYYDILNYTHKLEGEYDDEYRIFSGIIKNKSELKKLLKQLNIDETR